jgi:hypothetical protein
MLAFPTLCPNESVLEQGNPDPAFKSMMNVVHIDEKWFYLHTTNSGALLLPDEQPEAISVQHKGHIPKVMFLAAVARPRLDTNTGLLFDGKLGIFPFVERVPAQRSSANRPRGTLLTRQVSVNRSVYTQMMISSVLPAIRAKFPKDWEGKQSDDIFIQEDNAPVHFRSAELDPELAAALKGELWSFEIVKQPPNSPDLNVLDLGIFNALQSIQLTIAPNSLEDIVAATERAFNEISSEKLNDIFLTLQSVMVECLRNDGGNDFRIPHMRKATLARQGQLPLALTVPSEVFVRASCLARSGSFASEI